MSYGRYKQKDERFDYFLLRPNLNLNYPILWGKGNLRYMFNLTPRIPSLSNLSNNRQRSNDWEYHVGNPELKPYSRISQRLAFTYKHPRFYVENTLGLMLSKNAVMELITRHSDGQGNTWFDFSYANQSGVRQLSNYINLQLFVVPDVLTVEGGCSYLYARTEGDNYLHRFHRNWGYCSANLHLNKWSVVASWSARERNFDGESELYTGQNIRVQVNYRWNSNLTVGLLASHLFLKDGYRSGETTDSRLVRKWLHVSIPEWKNLLILRISWHFNRGRTYQSDNRGTRYRDTDTGVFKSK